MNCILVGKIIKISKRENSKNRLYDRNIKSQNVVTTHNNVKKFSFSKIATKLNINSRFFRRNNKFKISYKILNKQIKFKK